MSFLPVGSGAAGMGYDLLADAILTIHMAYVAYVVLGQGAIMLGLALKWSWIRNRVFRLSHLLAILIVAGEALFEIACPLTVWEARLRALAGHSLEQGSFIGRLLDNLLFCDVDPAVLAWIYIGFAVLVLGTLNLVPPRSGRITRAPGTPSGPGRVAGAAGSGA